MVWIKTRWPDEETEAQKMALSESQVFGGELEAKTWFLRR